MMPERCPKDAQKMPKRCLKDAQKIAKICLKGALGIPTKIISKVFIDSTVFLKQARKLQDAQAEKLTSLQANK